jgi:hypothetical protein
VWVGQSCRVWRRRCVLKRTTCGEPVMAILRWLIRMSQDGPVRALPWPGSAARCVQTGDRLCASSLEGHSGESPIWSASRRHVAGIALGLCLESVEGFVVAAMTAWLRRAGRASGAGDPERAFRAGRVGDDDARENQGKCMTQRFRPEPRHVYHRNTFSHPLTLATNAVARRTAGSWRLSPSEL